MFGKNKNSVVGSTDTIAPTAAPVEKSAPREEKQNNTVIASGVRFEGNIIACGQLHIYGEVEGNIESDGGIIKIMRNGLVQGNIACRELIVDGTLNGESKSDSIDIYEHGTINGAISYTTLAIKKGGTFVGQSTAIQVKEQKTNVIDIAAEKSATDLPEALNLEMAGEATR